MNAARPHSLSGLYIILDPSVYPARPLVEVLKKRLKPATPFPISQQNRIDERCLRGSLGAPTSCSESRRPLHRERSLRLGPGCGRRWRHWERETCRSNLARKVMGPGKLIGISTHNPDQVRAATAGKPDYLGFGPIFKPGSKLDHDPVVGLEEYVRCAGSVAAHLCDRWYSGRPGRGGH